MLKNIEIDELMEKTKYMNEYDKIDYLFTLGYQEAIENTNSLKFTGEPKNGRRKD
jgi:hypothetical protein